MKIYLATDHAGFKLKEKIKDFLIENNYKVEDCGAYENNPEDDYPDFIFKAAKSVAKNKNRLGIVFGGSGQGEAIAANKIKGIRAAVYNNENLELIKLSREHNNSNVLSIGARFVSEKNAINAVKIFLETKFPNEPRHKRRINKIKGIENELL